MHCRSVRDGWIRLLPGGMPMMAGFGRIENACAAPVTIVGVQQPGLRRVSAARDAHRRRRQPHARACPSCGSRPDDAAVLKPGGMHLMLMQPHAPLKAGSKVAVEFALKDGGVLRGEFVVRKPAD